MGVRICPRKGRPPRKWVRVGLENFPLLLSARSAVPAVAELFYLSLVFCCYQHVDNIVNMLCLEVLPLDIHKMSSILQLRGRGGMSTPQNSAAAYAQSHVSRICQVFCCLNCGFRLPECPSPMVLHRLSSDLTVFSQLLYRLSKQNSSRRCAETFWRRVELLLYTYKKFTRRFFCFKQIRLA